MGSHCIVEHPGLVTPARQGSRQLAEPATPPIEGMRVARVASVSRRDRSVSTGVRIEPCQAHRIRRHRQRRAHIAHEYREKE